MVQADKEISDELLPVPEQIEIIRRRTAADVRRIYALEQNNKVLNYEYIISIIKCLLASFAGVLLLYGDSESAFQVTPVPIHPVMYVFFAYLFADAVFTVVRVMAKAGRGE